MTHKPRRVLLIDCRPDGRNLAAKLRQDCNCVCDDFEELFSDPNAKFALDRDYDKYSENRPKRPLNEWLASCVEASGYDVIFLHTGNDYSMDYFDKMLCGRRVVLFSGDRARSWAYRRNPPLDEKECKLVDRELELEPYACDFVFEHHPSLPPPWDVFKGRSAQAKVRERLFSAAMVLGQKGTEQMAFEEPKDLSSELRIARERIEFVGKLELDESPLAYAAVQAVIKGEWPPRSYETSTNVASAGLEAVLKQLCPQLK